MSLENIIAEVENQTGVSNLAEVIKNRVALLFSPKETIEKFNKDFANSRTFVRERAVFLDKTFTEEAEKDPGLKALDASKKQMLLFNRLLQDVQNESLIVNFKNPGSAEFLLNIKEAKTTNAAIGKKLLGEQGLDIDLGELKKKGKKKKGKNHNQANKYCSLSSHEA